MREKGGGKGKEMGREEGRGKREKGMREKGGGEGNERKGGKG